MNRASVFIVALAIAAGALGFLLFGTSVTPPAQVDETPTPSPERVARTGTAPTAQVAPSLAAVDDAPSAPRGDGTGKIDKWRVTVMNHLGQPWPEANITASQGSTELKSTGSGMFEKVSAGTWDVTVAVEGMPTWSRQLDLSAGRSARTIAYIGTELRISGRVIDTDGEVVDDDWIMFIPKGATLPTGPESETITRSREKVATTENGVLLTRTARGNGRFALKIPSAGPYSIAVGKPHDPRWIEKKPRNYTHGGPDRAEVRVPAATSIELIHDGESDEHPTQVTAYYFDQELADRFAAQEAENERRGRRRGNISNEQRLLREEAIRDRLDQMQEDGIEFTEEDFELEERLRDKLPKPLGEQNKETFERNMALYGDRDNVPVAGEPQRAPLFERGWRPIRTVRFDGGRALVRNLPPNTQLKFLFQRSHERHSTATSVLPRNGLRSVAQLNLPRFEKSADRIVRTKEARVTLKTLPLDKDSAPAGVTWTIGRR